ncbi:MAG: phenylacetate--CoA ligase family protein [Pseudomonadota bacterium]
MTATYFEAVDHAALTRSFPLRDFLATYQGMSRDELRARQEAQFDKLNSFAWQVPFYRRHWGAQGIEPGDIRGLEDLPKLPTYSKSDLMASVEEYPPLGDFHGMNVHDTRLPLVFHTTSGTTGKPQPLLWGPKSREVQNILLARMYHLQGLNERDVIHSVYGFGLVNGGHYIREAIQHWIGAQVLTAGTGAETRSAQQVQMMRDFGATAIVGFGDYIRHLADVAREEGMEPGRDIRIRTISGHIGSDNAADLAAKWGAEHIYDWYGVGDTGLIAGQGPDLDGMHIMEDAQFVELLDPESHLPVADGEVGDLVCTCLYKDDIYPVIRFQTQDLTRILPGENALDLPFRRMAGHLGRSDNMVKLRGVNVYPQGVGALLTSQFAETNGEYVCIVRNIEARMDMTVRVEVTAPSADLGARMEALLKTRLGVQIGVEPVAPGETAALTQLEARQKPLRLVREAS